MKIVGMMLFVAAMAGSALAQAQDSAAVVPEIDGSTVVSGLALLSGAMLVIKSRFRK